MFDEKASVFVTDAMYVLTPRRGISPKALMGVMQSKLFHLLYTVANMGESRVIPQVKASKVLTLPIPEMTRCDHLIEVVDRMFALHQQLAAAKSGAHKAVLQRQIEATDAEIDRLVYDLYGLTPEEIAIVESEPRQ